MNGVSAHLNLDYDGCFFHCSCTLHRIRKTCIVAAFRLVRIEWEKGTAFEGDDHASKFAVGRLWIKAGSPFPDGNAGAVGFHHRAHNDAGGYHSTSLRTGWQRHLARLCAGDGGDSSGGVMHQPLRALLGFARLALYLRFDDSSAVARGHCRVEPVARIHRHRVERYRRVLPLRQLAASRCHRPRHFRGFPGAACHRHLHRNRLARRQNLGAADAVDRSGFGFVDFDRGGARSSAPRPAFGLDSASIARDDGKRAAAGLGAGALQLRWVRKRDDPRLGSAQPAENNTARGDPERPPCGRHFHRLRLHRSAWLAHGGARPGRQPSTDARARWRGGSAGSGIADRYRRASKHVCRNASVHHRSGARVAAHGSQRPHARLAAHDTRAA